MRNRTLTMSMDRDK